MRFADGHGNEVPDPLDGAPIMGYTGAGGGAVRYNDKDYDIGRIQPILNPTIGDFMTLPPGTECIFYQADPDEGQPGVYVAMVTQRALDDWVDLDPATSMGWTMIFYLLPDAGSKPGSIQ